MRRRVSFPEAGRPHLKRGHPVGRRVPDEQPVAIRLGVPGQRRLRPYRGALNRVASFVYHPAPDGVAPGQVELDWRLPRGDFHASRLRGETFRLDRDVHLSRTAVLE